MSFHCVPCHFAIQTHGIVSSLYVFLWKWIWICVTVSHCFPSWWINTGRYETYADLWSLSLLCWSWIIYLQRSLLWRVKFQSINWAPLWAFYSHMDQISQLMAESWTDVSLHCHCRVLNKLQLKSIYQNYIFCLQWRNKSMANESLAFIEISQRRVSGLWTHNWFKPPVA